MDRQLIEVEVNKIFKKKFSIDISSLSEEQKTHSLLDKNIGLLPRDLLVLFFELQEAFNISFREEDICEIRFDYYYNIIEIIYQRQALAC
jgi:peptide maturation system acyl carrier-related protein